MEMTNNWTRVLIQVSKEAGQMNALHRPSSDLKRIKTATEGHWAKCGNLKMDYIPENNFESGLHFLSVMLILCLLI